MLEMRVGDTGTMADNKKAEFSIDPLICRGDLMYDNAVTLFVKGKSFVVIVVTNLAHLTKTPSLFDPSHLSHV